MSDLKARLVGLGLVLLGLAVGWFFGLRALVEAWGGAESVSVEMKAFIVAPMAVLCGLFMIVGGGRVGEAMIGPPRTREQHLIVWPMFALALAAGAAGWWWMDGQLDALGYLTAG